MDSRLGKSSDIVYIRFKFSKSQAEHGGLIMQSWWQYLANSFSWVPI